LLPPRPNAGFFGLIKLIEFDCRQCQLAKEDAITASLGSPVDFASDNTQLCKFLLPHSLDALGKRQQFPPKCISN